MATTQKRTKARATSLKSQVRPQKTKRRPTPPRPAALPVVQPQPPSRPAPAIVFHRIHCSSGADLLTIYLPLDAELRLAPGGPRPWLLKARLAGIDFLGELEHEAGPWNVISWDCDDPDTFTDLGKAPLTVGRVVVLRDENETAWSLTVRHIARA